MLQSRSFPSTSPDEWYQLYQLAMLELDEQHLPLRIAEARRAIYDRAEKVITTSTEGERCELRDAIHALNVLERVATKQKPAA